MLKIYSRCLICILKVKYTEFKFPYFTTDSSALRPPGLPAVRPGSTMAMAPVFHTIKSRRIYETVVPKNVYPLGHGVSFYPSLLSFRLQIAYRKVRNSRIGVNKLVA